VVVVVTDDAADVSLAKSLLSIGDNARGAICVIVSTDKGEIEDEDSCRLFEKLSLF
ncbi:unnamed protein product, partial [Rotaria socialis]